MSRHSVNAGSEVKSRRPHNRAGLWAAGLAIGAILLLFLGFNPASATSGSTAESRSQASALGQFGASDSDPNIVAGQQLSPQQAAQRLGELKASGGTQPGATVPGNWVDPVPAARMTSCFCARWGGFHYGIDLAAPLGTPIYAAGDGVVIKAGPASGFGNAIYIQHANGDVSIYGHMYTVGVTAGQIVHAGDQIAVVGDDGESTGPHCHFEIHVGGINGQKVDPIPWLAARGVTIPGSASVTS